MAALTIEFPNDFDKKWISNADQFPDDFEKKGGA